jgi:biotin operon repressor
MQIIDYIGCGKENAIDRNALTRLTGLSDRAVREAIEQARHDGNIIINNQDGRGYYITANIDEIERQYRQNERRAKSILHEQKPLRHALRAAGRL